MEDDDDIDIGIDNEDNHYDDDDIEDLTHDKANKKKARENIQTCLDTKPMCTIAMWTDPHTYEEKVTVLLVLPSGVNDGEVVVPASIDGTEKLLVSYYWSEGFVNMKTMFDKDMKKGVLTATHPEVMAVNESLKNFRKNLDDIPTSIIEVKLPLKVQTAPKSYEHDVLVNKLCDGNHLVTLRVRLTAFSTEYIVSSDKKKMKIKFD